MTTFTWVHHPKTISNKRPGRAYGTSSKTGLPVTQQMTRGARSGRRDGADAWWSRTRVAWVGVVAVRKQEWGKTKEERSAAGKGPRIAFGGSKPQRARGRNPPLCASRF